VVHYQMAVLFRSQIPLNDKLHSDARSRIIETLLQEQVNEPAERHSEEYF